jgi:hypothetical protein
LETVASPWVRAGIEAGLGEEIDEHLGKITAVPSLSDVTAPSPVHEQQQLRQICDYGHSPSEKDLEIAIPRESFNTMKMKKIRHSNKAVYTSLCRTLFGSVYFSTQEANVEHLWEDVDEHDSATSRDQTAREWQRELATKITFVPSTWLCKTFLKHGLEISMRVEVWLPNLPLCTR